MIATWVGERFLADRRALAHLFNVSVRTVRRYCTPYPTAEQPLTDPTSGAVLYDALAAQDTLAGVVGRPERTAAATRARVAAAAAQAKRALKPAVPASIHTRRG